MTVLWYVFVMSILLSKNISKFSTVFTAIQLPKAVKYFFCSIRIIPPHLCFFSVFLNIPQFPPLCLFIPLICSPWIHNQTWKPKIAPFSPFFFVLQSSQNNSHKTTLYQRLTISFFLLYDYVLKSPLIIPFISHHHPCEVMRYGNQLLSPARPRHTFTFKARLKIFFPDTTAVPAFIGPQWLLPLYDHTA